MKGIVGEKGILPERSEWFRSRQIIGTKEGVIPYVHVLWWRCGIPREDQLKGGLFFRRKGLYCRILRDRFIA